MYTACFICIQQFHMHKMLPGVKSWLRKNPNMQAFVDAHLKHGYFLENDYESAT